jgi:hypothetical protein
MLEAGKERLLLKFMTSYMDLFVFMKNIEIKIESCSSETWRLILNLKRRMGVT